MVELLLLEGHNQQLAQQPPEVEPLPEEVQEDTEAKPELVTEEVPEALARLESLDPPAQLDPQDLLEIREVMDSLEALVAMANLVLTPSTALAHLVLAS